MKYTDIEVVRMEVMSNNAIGNLILLVYKNNGKTVKEKARPDNKQLWHIDWSQHPASSSQHLINIP